MTTPYGLCSAKSCNADAILRYPVRFIGDGECIEAPLCQAHAYAVAKDTAEILADPVVASCIEVKP